MFDLIRHSIRLQWSAYFLLLLILGFVQLWDARLFTWYTDDFDYLDHISKIEGNVWYLFSPEHRSSGRPSTSLFFIISHALWDEEQVPYHLTLIFFHILTVWILAWSLSHIGFRRGLSMVTGILFLFNVSRYEVPYWLSCFSYLGCLSFGCLGIARYTKYAFSDGRGDLAYASVLILVSTSFHAGALMFAVLGPYFAFRRGAALRTIARSCWIPIVLSVGLSTLTFLTFADHAQNKNVTQIHDIFHVARLTLAYLGRTFLSPHWLTRAFLGGPSFFDTIVGALLIASAAILMISRRCTPLDAVVWSALALPIFGGSPITEYRSRYFYFSSVGPSLLIGWGFLTAGEWLSSTFWRQLRWAIPGIGLVGILAISHVQLKKTESRFWAITGRSYIALSNSYAQLELGIRLISDGIVGAPEYLSRIYYIRYGVNAQYVGTSPTSILEIGRDVYPGDIEIALLHEVADYITARRPLPPNFVARVVEAGRRTIASVSAALNNAGIYHYLRNEYKQAERLLASAIQIDPDYHRATATYANCLAYQGRLDDAMIAFERFYQIDEGGLYKNVIPGLKVVVDANPQNLKARHYLAIAYTSVGNFVAATNQIEAGLAKDPANSVLWQDYVAVAQIYRERGEIEKANAILRRTLNRGQ